MVKKDKTITIDVVLGLLSLIISFSLISLLGLKNGSILMGLITLLIGFFRYQESKIHPVAKAFLLIAPYALLLGGAMNGVIHLLFLFIVAFLGSMAGVYIRVFFWNRRVILSLSLLVTYLTFIYFFGSSFLPAHYNRTNWDTSKREIAFSYQLSKPNGDTLFSKELKGKVIVMDFWATWCGPCKAQFPVLEKLHKKYKGDERIVFLCIHCSRKRNEKMEKAVAFIKNSKFDLPFMIDPNDEVMDKFAVISLPTTFIIDQKGIVRFEHNGFMKEEDFFEECSKRIEIVLKKQ